MGQQKQTTLALYLFIHGNVLFFPPIGQLEKLEQKSINISECLFHATQYSILSFIWDKDLWGKKKPLYDVDVMLIFVVTHFFP